MPFRLLKKSYTWEMLTYYNSVPGFGNKATPERQNPEAAECWPLQCPSSASALSPPPPDDLIHLDSVPPVSAHLDNTLETLMSHHSSRYYFNVKIRSEC